MGAASRTTGSEPASGQAGSFSIPRLTLVPDGKDLDTGDAVAEPVQRDISGLTVGDHEFTQPSSDRPTDVRVTFQHPNRVYDDLRRVDGRSGFDRSKEFE